jgi:hypothetical protein
VRVGPNEVRAFRIPIPFEVVNGAHAPTTAPATAPLLLQNDLLTVTVHSKDGTVSIHPRGSARFSPLQNVNSLTVVEDYGSQYVAQVILCSSGRVCVIYYVCVVLCVVCIVYRVVFCVLYCVLCIVYCVLCIVYCVLCIVYCVLCIVYCVLCIVYCVLCIVYCVLCIVYCVLCIVYSVLCIVYCIVYCVVCGVVCSV